MIECPVCNKEFPTKRALGGHMRMHGPSGGELVTKRLDPRFGVKSSEYTTKVNAADGCLQCGGSFKYHRASTGKFCSNKCQGAYSREEANKRVIEGSGSSKALKRVLIERDGYNCSKCGISEWQGEYIALHLDHIDGNSDNNKLENGRILCPNCHSQTPTFTGKNIKNTKRNRYLQAYKAEKKQIGQGRGRLGTQ